jgi:hypothetical protein
MACYDGRYPVPYDPALDKNIMERRRARLTSVSEALEREQRQIRLI